MGGDHKKFLFLLSNLLIRGEIIMLNILKKCLNNNCGGIGKIVTLLILVGGVAIISSSISDISIPVIKDVNERAINNITSISGGGF